MSRALPALLVALAACDGGGEGVADAGPDARFGCFSEEGGADMGIDVGYLDGEQFIAHVDGDDTLLVKGAQDLWMIWLESRVTMAVDADEVCLQCVFEVSPSESGSYPGFSRSWEPTFDRVEPDVFAFVFWDMLGSVSNPEPFADAIVDVSLQCEGHGFSGAVERQRIKLTLPPP